MMLLLLLLHVAHVESVFSQGPPRLVLRNKTNPCQGHVEVRYKGQWGLVGDQSWSSSTEKVVCSSTHCGEPVKDGAQEAWRPPGSLVWLNEVKCKGNESELWGCDSPGWNISYYPKHTVKKIKCSNVVKFKLDGSRCAGAVQYFTGEAKPAGYICGENNWSDEAAKLLCGQLECGGLKEIPSRSERMTGRAFQGSEKMRLNCTDLEGIDNLWQCVAPDSAASPCQRPATVICTGHRRLQIKATKSSCSGQLQEEESKDKWVNVDKSTLDDVTKKRDSLCREMHCGSTGNVTPNRNSLSLKCSDTVKVVLRDQNNKEDSCYGTVHVKVNGSAQAVCGSTWTEKEAKVVCKELGCGSVNSHSTRSATSGIMDFVECSGKEASLWHCQAKHGKDLPCSAAAYVVCSDSLKVRLEDGGGPCAGRLEVRHEGQWKAVHKTDWTDDHSNRVCKDLGCGEQILPGPPEKYSQGSGSFLAVKCEDISSVLNITECTITNSDQRRNEQLDAAVGITCEGHKMVFLNGSCSGKVGIKHGSNTFWLSGSEATWTNDSANAVCRQMHCGVALAVTSEPRGAESVWSKSYNCSSNSTSLFECHTALPLDKSYNCSSNETSQSECNNQTIASVTCSGSITVGLTNSCWGNVEVCVEGKGGKTCGGVCADAWGKEKSKMLCKECGNEVLESIFPSRKTKITFKSLHAMQHIQDLNQCNFIEKQDNDQTCKAASVVCSGSIQSRFSPSRDKCSGNLEVLYEGKWLPVCEKALQDLKTQNAICRDLGCGKAVKILKYFGPKPASSEVIKELQCSASDPSSLRECSITAKGEGCVLAGLQCSEWKKVALEYSDTCQGEVVVYSAGNKVSAVSRHGWTEKEGGRLCQDMKCGSNSSIRTDVNWVNRDLPLFNGNFSCDGGEESIWDCENKTRPSEKNETWPSENLFIECQNKTKVTLSQKCHGELRINDVPVCASQWHKSYSDRVCQELGCSNAVFLKEGDKLGIEGPYYHVHCDEHHQKLGQCRQVLGSCDAKLVYIYCVGNIKFSSTEKCGGEILVNYRDKWENVCVEGKLSTALEKKLCQEINCQNPIKIPKSNVNLETKLMCTENHMDVKHCVQYGTCTRQTAAQITSCDGYQRPTRVSPTQPPPPPPVEYIIIGVLFLAVVVILIAVGARFYLTRRNRKSMMMLPGKEVEFESGEYEDVENEMDDFRRGRFRSESEFAREDERRSNASLSYDDVNEAAEAQPLTSAADAADASGDAAVDEDKVTYEGEDPQENYDDIESAPEVTEAEVHDSPKATTNHDAAAPPEPAQGNEDYLVPGQDG